METLTDQFLTHLSVERGCSRYTLRNYRQTLAEFESFRGSGDCATVTRVDLRSYLRNLSERKLSPPSIRLRFAALRRFYKFLIRRGIVDSSPVRGTALSRTGYRLPKFLTLQQTY